MHIHENPKEKEAQTQKVENEEVVEAEGIPKPTIEDVNEDTRPSTLDEFRVEKHPLPKRIEEEILEVQASTQLKSKVHIVCFGDNRKEYYMNRCLIAKEKRKIKDIKFSQLGELCKFSTNPSCRKKAKAKKRKKHII